MKLQPCKNTARWHRIDTQSRTDLHLEGSTKIRSYDKLPPVRGLDSAN